MNLLLFGGGLDSTCLAAYLYDNNIDYIFFFIDYGQKAKEGELNSATYYSQYFNKKLVTIETDFFKKNQNPILNGEMATKHSDNVLPMRNQIFFDIAMNYAILKNIENIYVGFHQEPTDSQFFDAKMEFVNAYNELLKSQFINVQIRAPFSNMTQNEYLHNTIKQKGLNFLTKSFSCYEHTTTECGCCTHCKHKKELIERASIGINEWRD